jgi:DNA-binding transcriptional ArsR family regulator
VRILAHPLRLRLLELFAESPCTPKQAAERLGLPPTRLYHHVAALERVGLVRVRETRRNRGTVEKHYEAVARGFEMDPEHFARGRGAAARRAATRLAGRGAAAIAMRVLERAGEELMAALEAPGVFDSGDDDAASPLAMRVAMVASPQELAAVRRELLALMERWQNEGKTPGPPGGETRRASVTIVMAPEPAPLGKPRKTAKAAVSGSGGRKPGGGA